MHQPQKRLILIIALILGVLCIELLRENIVYQRLSRKLDYAYLQIKPNMAKDDVKLLAGEPDAIQKNEQLEYWNWDTGNHQGYLCKLLGLTWKKGHTTLSVEFDDQEKVSRSWGGIN